MKFAPNWFVLFVATACASIAIAGGTLAPAPASPQRPVLTGQAAQRDSTDVPCHPDSTLPQGVTIGPNGDVINSDPADIEVGPAQTVTTEEDVATDFPGLDLGNDTVIARNPCEGDVDLDMPLPPMGPPQVNPPPDYKAPNISMALAPLPPVALRGPVAGCLVDAADPCKGPPLNCSLPFCGRDIIFVHGFVNESLEAAIKAQTGFGGDPRSLARWPQDATQFTQPGGYFHDWAYERWTNFIKNKLAEAYANAGATHGPRFLVTAWAAPQRMDIATHAVLTQMVDAIGADAGVMTVGLTGNHDIVPASSVPGWVPHSFCSRGCIIVSHSTGGPVTAAAMSIAATPGSRVWATASLAMLPRYIKGHVAFHPALGGSPLADVGVGVGLMGGPSCLDGLNILSDLLSSSSPFSNSLPACQAMMVINHSVLVDLMTPTMNVMWRPLIQNVPSASAVNVPGVIIAGAHPTAKPYIHFVRPLLPGFDDSVLPVDSQMGRPWAPGYWPTPELFLSWGLFGAKYYDRGSPLSKAIPYFVDQNLELLHTPLTHAAAPNPYLLPTGMILPGVNFNLVPSSSSGMRNYYSFLQSTSPHFFPRWVGSGDVSSQPTDPSDSCPAGSYNYQPTAVALWGITPWPVFVSPVLEESRAVFDPAVYTTIGRNHFAVAEIGSGGGPGLIPVLSPRLKTAIELEAKGQYIPINIRWLNIHEKIWLWKRQYLRMQGWRCRDEIDYALDFAFRK